MLPPTTTCALCLQPKPLLDSHFIPAAIYKNLIDPTGTIKNMIATNLSVASEESKQVKKHLLCQDCEIRFQQGGESWVLARRLTPKGSFILRDLLLQSPALGTKNGASFYSIDSIITLREAQLVYFAASIFWRAAVTDWETPLGHYAKLALAPSVVEDLRKYLLGTNPFPSDQSIIAFVSAATEPVDVTTLPTIAKDVTAYQQVDWFMPGLGFSLLLGAGVPQGIKAIAISQSPHTITIDPRFDERVEKAGLTHAKNSIASENLQKKLDQTSGK